MKITVIDSVGCNAGEGGRPAQFSEPTIAWLEKQGHEVTVIDTFDVGECASADAVWTEWCNEDAFAAARSGICKRLVIRLRGYEVFAFPLEQLHWKNVTACVFESKFLQALVDNRIPKTVEQQVLPAGIDLDRFPFKPCEQNTNVVAMLGRADMAKGYQIALEWARTTERGELHIVLAGGDPRVSLYIQHAAPPNVFVTGGPVDTAAWLQAAEAGNILSASTWESLGYTILEGMAMGLRPLVHDRPGTDLLWHFPCWRTVVGLEALFRQRSAWDDNAKENRQIIENHFDAAKLSPRFAQLLGVR